MKNNNDAQREKAIRKVTFIGAVVNILLTVCKIIAGIYGKSAAMMADGVHSLSDLLSDFVVLVFTKISSKKNDRDHSFGHGKFETLATAIVSIILVVVGVRLMVDAIERVFAFFSGEEIARPGVIALVAAIVSIFAKEVLFRVTKKVGDDVNSPVVVANAWHHRSDALSSIGSFAGIGGAMLLGPKWYFLDPVVCIIISIAIIVVAVKMAVPALDELLDKSLPDENVKKIEELALGVPGVRNIHELKTRRSGIDVLIEAHILVDPSLTIVQAHEISTNVEKALESNFGYHTQINIHVEPDVK
ncbi:MAG: cation diffusion facilitator family transporter [Candidatus Coprenecus sp.]|nr:cation diffusion facilitator family transporter [Candidatus Coprenecus sp.]